MEASTPIVSIIVPAYNVEAYISEVIQSVFDQTLVAWELLIIDDGSRDNTASIVKSFSDPRVILVQQANGGVSAARNIGLERAKGKYITFFDADDILPLNSLKARVAYLENHPDVDLVDGNICIKDSNMEKDIRIYVPYYEGVLFPRLMALDARVFFNVCYMFRKDILGHTRFKVKMTHAEDLLFYMELSSMNHVKYGFVSETVYWYRSGNESAMTNLVGLEDGYLQLITEVKKLQNISNIDLFMFKTKIAKIMFLSWLSQGKIQNALKSVYYIYQITSKDNI